MWNGRRSRGALFTETHLAAAGYAPPCAPPVAVLYLQVVCDSGETLERRDVGKGAVFAAAFLIRWHAGLLIKPNRGISARIRAVP